MVNDEDEDVVVGPQPEERRPEDGAARQVERPPRLLVHDLLHGGR
ncbi:MAG TPA: hypothetical protein VHG91_12570 [Longimicrobium sp.]|nr:hypothetical protein [Longimicrobium sp.]